MLNLYTIPVHPKILGFTDDPGKAIPVIKAESSIRSLECTRKNCVVAVTES
ncbi:hypothetical protein HNQ77_001757 [Silvibacterium bohemicum]|uniref:Uncharacterized protein n=1 Tax=Silvibacterium bohemicum TaxID=1577686 RepID=A0A841JZF0_9BACT|nr:hypothetical protein [Silvibacterium bohemicum]